MSRLSTQNFENWTKGVWSQTPPREIEAFNIDSRIVRAGELFVALKTSISDGHDFVRHAEEQGAVAAIVEQEIEGVTIPQLVVADSILAFQAIARKWREQFSIPVIGVTGSCGKTSTKDLLATFFEPNGLKTQGNLNNYLGVPLTLTRLRESHSHAVVEVGMNIPGEIATMAEQIKPDYALITTVAPVHLQGVGSLQGVATEKAALAEAATVRAVLPVECFRYTAFRELTTACIIAGKAEPGCIYPEGTRFVDFEIQHDEEGTLIKLTLGENPEMVFRAPRVSDGMAHNAVLSLILGFELGLTLESMQEHLSLWSPGSMRGERKTLGNLDFYIDCYNSNPTSMRDSLDFFHATSPEDKPRIYILSSMSELGEYADEYHRALGQRFKLREMDSLFITGKNVAAFKEGFRSAGRDETNVVFFERQETVVERLKGLSGTVLLKGSRGYVLENIFNQLSKELQSAQSTC